MIKKSDYDDFLDKKLEKYDELKEEIIKTQNYINNNSLFFKEEYKNGNYKINEEKKAIGELIKALNDIYILAFTDMETRKRGD